MSKKRIFALRLGAICAVVLLAGCSSSPQQKEAKFLKRGKALLEKKDYSRASLEFKNAEKAVPKDAEPYYQSGLAYLAAGELGNAVKAFRQATKSTRTCRGAIKTRRFDDD